MSEEIEEISAVFAVSTDRHGNFVATTRDTGTNAFGFAGGKVDEGENPREALFRECKEEGVYFQDIEDEPFFTATVEGKTVAWFRAKDFHFYADYKEKHRGIKPVFVTLNEAFNMGFENDRAVTEYLRMQTINPFHCSRTLAEAWDRYID